MVLLDEWLSMTWHMFCKLAMVRPTKWCTTNLRFIKFGQDGSQYNSQRCINNRTWTSAKNIWISMVTNETSLTEWSLVTKHGSIITSRRVNGRVWNGNFNNRPARKSSKPNNPQENWCLQCFWDSQGPVLEYYQERDTTINSAQSSEMLTDGLKPAIRSKHRGLLLKGVVLLHDNGRPHCWNTPETQVWSTGSSSG